jgi:ligand-binding sensor domain-containing protein
VEKSGSNNPSIVHKETVSYTKKVQSHLFRLPLFVQDSLMWCASGDHLRVFDTTTGKILRMIDTKASMTIRALIPVGDQVWAGSADKKIYVLEQSTDAFIKVHL